MDTTTDHTFALLQLTDRKATRLFTGTSLVAAITVGSMLVGDWGGGVLDNRIEWLFWTGAIFGAVGIALFGAAALPVNTVTERAVRRANGLVRAGLVLFVIAPVLCVTAVMVDYWI